MLTICRSLGVPCGGLWTDHLWFACKEEGTEDRHKGKRDQVHEPSWMDTRTATVYHLNFHLADAALEVRLQQFKAQSADAEVMECGGEGTTSLKTEDDITVCTA